MEEEQISLEEINANLRDAFGIDAIDERSRKAAEKLQAQEQALAAKQAQMKQAEEPPYVPVDIYQRNYDARWDELNKKRPKGSSMLVKAVTESIINGSIPGEGLAAAHRKAEDDSDSLRDRGEIERADIARKQYMEEKFLPAVEAVVNYTSPDELLNCKDALAALDKYALGVGKSKGYTAAYIRSAYGDLLGQDLNGNLDRSDDAVRKAVCRIKELADHDEIRTAIGVANQIKKQIDNGEHIATDEDYALIGRVSAFGN